LRKTLLKSFTTAPTSFFQAVATILTTGIASFNTIIHLFLEISMLMRYLFYIYYIQFLYGIFIKENIIIMVSVIDNF
jgi:hypothetical protein